VRVKDNIYDDLIHELETKNQQLITTLEIINSHYNDNCEQCGATNLIISTILNENKYKKNIELGVE
jgi:hypothetical protein